GKKVGRFVRCDEKNVDRLATQRLRPRDEAAFATAQIKLTPGTLNEHGPAISAYQKGDGNGRAMSGEKCELPVDHSIERAASIELRAALAESEDRCISVENDTVRGAGFESELLDDFASSGVQRDREWLRLDC